jgi:hypothetical protein
MPGLVPASTVVVLRGEADGRDKPGHDAVEASVPQRSIVSDGFAAAEAGEHGSIAATNYLDLVAPLTPAHTRQILPCRMPFSRA